jgi:hypothetical protein
LIPNPTVNYTSPNSTGTLTFAPATNDNGSAVITVIVDNGQLQNNIATQIFTVTVTKVYQAPTLAAIGNVSINSTAGQQSVVFSGVTLGSSSTATVTATSSNPSLIPNPAVNYTSPNSSGTLYFAPATTNASGSATITVTVNNGQPQNNTATRTFTVNVTKTGTTYTAPTLAPISNITVSGLAAPQMVGLSGITTGSGSSVKLTATSSNPGLIPNPTLSYNSPDSIGSLTFSVATNLSGTALITVTANNSQSQNNTVSQTFVVTVNKVYQAPTLSPLGDVSISGQAKLQTIAFSGVTLGSGSTAIISALSSNPGLIPNPTVNYTTPNSSGTLTFAPAASTTGSATITVIINNGQLQNNIVIQTFTVNVTAGGAAANQAPTLDPLSDQTILYNAPAQTIDLTGISSGSPSEFQPLSVQVTSSNTKLIPTPIVDYSSPLATGKLTFKPANNASGSAVITVTVSDGGATNNFVNRFFTITVKSKTASVQPPTIETKPKNQLGLVGKNVTLKVVAKGDGPLKYQWQCNGTNIPNAKSANLSLQKLAKGHCGTYTVTVSNGGGSVTSGPASVEAVSVPTANLTPAAEHIPGKFSFDVEGISGYKYVVQASTDMVHWTPVQTNTAPFTFAEPTSSQSARKFYRTVAY